MTDPIVVFLTLLIVGQTCLSVPLLLARAKNQATYLHLALFLFGCGMLAMNNIVIQSLPQWYHIYTVMAFPTLFMLCPSLWFYVKGITAQQAFIWQRKHAWHYVLLAPAVLVSGMILFLPEASHSAIFIDDESVSTPLAKTIIISLLIMMLLWLTQCILTLFLIVKRLKDYRKRLKDFFSNNEHHDLKWFNWLMYCAISFWLLSLVSVFSSSLFNAFLYNARTEAFITLCLLWSLAHFGLQQKPVLTTFNESDTQGFLLEDKLSAKQSAFEATASEPLNIQDTLEAPKKYQRSALNSEQANRIAEKINTAMQEQHLYLDPSLTLHKLAAHLSISPNYLSQTLNETLGVNFFDYVNQWRIEAAKPKIIANQDTVLDIALDVGFNARSSFYKAFKQATGQTPSEYRKVN
ncbi:helix-turn-helix domain-containing protein [Pseudoalteromonas sp. SS15]|uniref:helix-turn-helix domain-containing protein n=1 Tax=Pseudoalteromonas sp. SS15 TaxID=3139393 RepID=UPI003BAC1909